MEPQDTHDFRLVLLTGMSGAGRSTAARALEDLGWFVIDNIPPALIDDAVELARRTPDVDRVAVVVDVRGGRFFTDLLTALEVLPTEGVHAETVFLEASDESIVRRYESSRRRTRCRETSRRVGSSTACSPSANSSARCERPPTW